MRHIEITDAITDAQNRGELCPHCGSNSGHFIHCALINRNVAEAKSARLSDADNIRLTSLGVRW
jgi:hypothetical protein